LARLVRIALLLAAVLVHVGATTATAASPWRWPARGPVLREFHFSAVDRYAGGQHRGITIGAGPGAPVGAPCSGRVTWAGRVGATGHGVAVACGRLNATLTRLGAVATRRGRWVSTGTPLGIVGPRGAFQLGARVRARRDGYLDPLGLLAGDPAPPLGVAPPASVRRGPRGPAPVTPLRPVGAPAPARTPLVHWGPPVGLALLVVALGFGAVRRARAFARDVRPRPRAGAPEPRPVVRRVRP
jgi:hypothetical protein